MPEYTLVIGVDAKHLQQLEVVVPTWRIHKPSLFEVPAIVFVDSVPADPVRSLLPHATIYRWPPDGVTYPEGDTKWDNAQRHKMLAGFVHVAAEAVRTQYWLKLDTDAIATGQDNWIDESWFTDTPGTVAPPWHYTKPPDQMLKLDEWADGHFVTPPLNLAPAPGSNLVRHKRVCGWVGFHNTDMTRDASSLASETCGYGHLPVPSQDGYLWYYCQRAGWEVHRVRMNDRGWTYRTNLENIRQVAKESMSAA